MSSVPQFDVSNFDINNKQFQDYFRRYLTKNDISIAEFSALSKESLKSILIYSVSSYVAIDLDPKALYSVIFNNETELLLQKVDDYSFIQQSMSIPLNMFSKEEYLPLDRPFLHPLAEINKDKDGETSMNNYGLASFFVQTLRQCHIEGDTESYQHTLEIIKDVLSKTDSLNDFDFDNCIHQCLNHSYQHLLFLCSKIAYSVSIT